METSMTCVRPSLCSHETIYIWQFKLNLHNLLNLVCKTLFLLNNLEILCAEKQLKIILLGEQVLCFQWWALELKLFRPGGLCPTPLGESKSYIWYGTSTLISLKVRKPETNRQVMSLIDQIGLCWAITIINTLKHFLSDSQEKAVSHDAALLVLLTFLSQVHEAFRSC